MPKFKFIFTVVLALVLALPAAAKTYTKVEVLTMWSGQKFSTSYVLNNHTCDFDMDTSDMVFYIYSAYTDGTIDGAWVKYLGHKYTNLTGLIKSKNKKFYQIMLRSDEGEGPEQYGRITFKVNFKKKKPDVGHGTTLVQRTASNDYSACSSKSTF